MGTLEKKGGSLGSGLSLRLFTPVPEAKRMVRECLNEIKRSLTSSNMVGKRIEKCRVMRIEMLNSLFGRCLCTDTKFQVI